MTRPPPWFVIVAILTLFVLGLLALAVTWAIALLAVALGAS